MTQQTEELDAHTRGAFDALKRAAASARKLAMQTDTYIVVMEEGVLRQISAAELRERYDQDGLAKQ